MTIVRHNIPDIFVRDSAVHSSPAGQSANSIRNEQLQSSIQITTITALLHLQDPQQVADAEIGPYEKELSGGAEDDKAQFDGHLFRAPVPAPPLAHNLVNLFLYGRALPVVAIGDHEQHCGKPAHTVVHI